MDERSRNTLLAIVTVVSLLPLGWLVVDIALSRLGPNPIREIQIRTGTYTLVVLLASIACTPAYTLTGVRAVFGLRRSLGLYAFIYAALHFLNLVAVDYLLDLKSLWRDIAQKPYIVVGFGAFFILLTLAITSTSGWKARLGKNWKRLHRLVYAAGVLAVLHYLWQVKATVPGPFIAGASLGLLLLLRVPAIERLAVKHIPWRAA